MFPGQGSQAKGMGAELFDEFPKLVSIADEILGYSIKQLCLHNPEKRLDETQYTQPALFTVSALSYYKKMKTETKPDYLAGHSLGEFNALLAAEVFDFETGLKLVKRRGELMCKVKQGGMAAILNLAQEQIEAILKKNGLFNIELANYNTSSQIVISGDINEIAKAQDYFQFDQVRYYPLSTGGAFHSRFMRPIKEEFKVYLEGFDFSDPSIPVISNVTAQAYASGQVVENLSEQLCNGVRWSDSMAFVMSQVDDRSAINFEEVGYGEVLTKIIRAIRKETAHLFEGPELQAKDFARSHSDIEQKVMQWNAKYPVGMRFKSTWLDYGELMTRTEAIILYGRRGVVYMNDYEGYFEIVELEPVN